MTLLRNAALLGEQSRSRQHAIVVRSAGDETLVRAAGVATGPRYRAAAAGAALPQAEMRAA